MNNNISNQKKEVPKGLALNDMDYITELLTTLKDIQKNYCIAMTEASNEILYNEFYNMFCGLSDLQRETYELMFQYGWYILEKAETNKINTKYSNLNQKMCELE